MSIIAKENTDNRKIGNASTTYSGLNTCPNSCPFKKSKACYAMCGPIGLIFRRLSTRTKPEIEAKAEAEGILGMTGEKDLRIHTTGDCPNSKCAKTVSKAAEAYMSRFNRKSWTFTHAWREVKRKDWGKVSVLASCEKTSEVKEARKRGYATSLVFPTFPSDKAFQKDGLTIIPCPNQVAKKNGKKVTCTQCRLCLNDANLLKKKVTIAFQVHGPSVKATKMLTKMEKANGTCKTH